MSTVLEHSANANATIEYVGKLKFGQIPSWIKERQIEKYYASMSEFYTECISELRLPDRFEKKELNSKLMESLRAFLRQDKDFTTLISRLTIDYPRFPMDNKTASEYLIGLKDLCARVATAGQRLNEEIAWSAIRSKIPFIVFGNLYLTDYTISYFHEYRAKMTEQHFRRNHFLIRERVSLRKRKIALDNYFNILKPAEDLFRTLLKAQFKLWLYIALSDFANSKDFPSNPQESAYEVDQEEVQLLESDLIEKLDEMRSRLYDAEPTLFNPTIYNHPPTETFWKNMVLIGITQ